MKRMALVAIALTAVVGCRDGVEQPITPSPDEAPTTPEVVTPPKVILTLPEPEPQPEAAPTIKLVMGEATVEAEPSKRPARARTTRGARPTGSNKATATPARKVSIMGTIRKNWGDVERCYGTAVAKDPSLAGKITFKWTLGATGTPSAVSVVRDTLAKKTVGSCIRKRAMNWKFPPPQGGVGVVKYTYDLRTQ